LGRAQGRLPSDTEIRVSDYDDVGSLSRAFQGVRQLVFIPSDGFAQSVLGHVRNVIEAAQEGGVRRVVLLSIVDVAADSPFYYAPVYRDAESRLAGSGLEWTILRCGLYSDFIRDAWLRPALRSGKLSLPAGSARVAPISRDDVALAVAAAVDTDGAGEIFSLTGSEAVTFEEIARVFGDAQGTALTYEPIQPADYLLRLWDETEDPWPHAFSTLLASIAQGRFGLVSDDFRRLVGHEAAGLSILALGS